MECFKVANANELFIEFAKKLLEKGHINNPRGLETKELCDVWIELTNPLDNIVTLKSRDINLDYLNGEMEWYLSGSLNVDDIAKHSRFWERLADSNGTVNSNYGFLILKEKHAGKSQLEWCINTLKKDKYSRQAIMNYNQPRHKYEGNKDFVCTLTQMFVVRNDKLDSIVMMRSNDLIYGLTYDLPWFTKIQQMVADEIGIEIGNYIHYAASLHVYKKHYKMLEDIANEK